MHTTILRKVGGSVMLAVPPAVLEPKPRKRYSLDELLAKCDAEAEPGPEEREWLDSKSTGGELL